MYNRKLFAFLVLAVVLAAGQVFAQTAFNTGSIYGKVFGADGQPLPGVTVTVETQGASPKTAFTGDSGSYRFAGLVVGTYSVTFSLQGFTEVRQEDVKLGAGQNINLEITLKQATSEQVVVTGEAPVVDTKKTSTSSSYPQEYLKNVPSARDPWVILDQTPGIDVDRVNVGGSQSGQQSNYTSKGGSFASNGWSYDGVDITDPAAQGATPTYYDFDSFDEIQITTGGQDPAIATGGVVINFVTKRGGNTWSGSGSVYFDNHSLQGSNLDSALVAQHFVRPNEINQIYEWGGDVGGPVAKDKAWIWGSYRKQDIQTFTAITQRHDQRNPALNGTLSGGAPQHIQLDDVNAKFNVSYNAANEGSFQYLYGNKRFAGRFSLPPDQQAPESLWKQSGPTNMLKAEHSWIPNPNAFLDLKFAYVNGGFTFASMPGVDPNTQPVFRRGAYTYVEHGTLSTYDTKRPQYNFTADSNFFKQNWGGGDHEFKFGFAYKHATITSISNYPGGMILYDYAGSPHDVSDGAGLAKLKYGDYKYRLNSLGAYAGDTWRMKQLTLNLGVRFDHYTSAALPSSEVANPVAPDLLPAISFSGAPGPSISDVSPRVGATWDVTNDGKTVIRGNYARFYDGLGPTAPNLIDPLNYTGLYVYYADLNGDGQITRNELLDSKYGIYSTFGGMVPGNAAATIAKRAATRHFASDLKGQSTDEFMAGFERQLGTNVSAGVSYIHRKYGNLQDTYRPGVTSQSFVCTPTTVTNPVTHQTWTVPFCDLPAGIDADTLLNVANRTRTYDGVEFSFNKRMSNHWMARVTAEIKNQKIHYNDNGATFGGSYQDPTNIAFTNNTWWAEQSTGSGSGGVFTGSRWGIKLSGAYQFPHDFTVGGYFKALDGDVVPIIHAKFSNYYLGFTYPLLQTFDSVRLKNMYYADLKIEKGFGLGTAGKIAVSADIFNLFNTNYTTRQVRRAETYTFGEATEIVSPRILRLGLRYNF